MERVRAGRAVTYGRVKERIAQAVSDGEVSAPVDIDAVSRFVQAVQSGMSIMARDGASFDELRSVAEVAMGGWDACVPSRDARA